VNVQEYVGSLQFGGDCEENGDQSRDTLPQKPKLVAEREVESRIERLNEVWGHANATVRSLSHKYENLWDGAITELADYKGTLYVTWRDELSRVMFEGVILGAWEQNGEHAHSHSLAS
jgi:hypothetical protein